MAYCINPDCSQRENPDNCAVCENCKTPLILQNRYRIKHPLQIDRYRYTEVFEIEDLVNQNQPKVLKSLKEVTPDLLRLFEQEASILTSLQHPGLPAGEIIFPLVLNTGRQLRCLVMEKVEGEDLQNWLNHHQYVTSHKQALDWLKQLTQILQFVHENGYFHRDIKPSNIMLRPDGKLVLIDFGTARNLSQTIVNGKSITVIHSVGYTAPEQLDGQAVLQSDFYALGLTFIYLITGIDPASDRRQDLRHWYIYVKDQQTPQKFIDLIQAMTNYHPQKRPPTTQAILQKIQNIDKYSLVRWQKLLLSATCGVLLFVGAKWVYEVITLAPTCDYIQDDHLSCGEESLIPASYWGTNDQPPQTKQLAIEQYHSKNFSAAKDLFITAFNQESDPETLIYLNNAKIQMQFPAAKIRTIAVAVPLERRTTIGLETLRGAAQAQTEALKNGLPLRIIIADDSNRDDSKAGNDARKIAQKLVKYSDLLAVLGHNSSEATKQALPIYTKAGVVLVSATSTSNNLKSPFFFRTVPSDRIAGQKMATYVFSQLRQRKVAIFYSKGSEFAESLSRAFREAAKSFPGNVLDYQPAFNLASDRFNAKASLNQAKAQGATVIVVIPDAGVGLYNAIPNALEVIRSNVNHSWIVGGDSLYNSDLLKPNKGLSLEQIQRLALAIAWHPLNDINSSFVQQAQTLWKIDPTDISWRTVTSYDAVLVLSKALKTNSTRIGIQKTLAMPKFSVKGATGDIQFQGSDRYNGTIAIVAVRPKCNSSGFVFVASDRPLVCY
ncbi:bifunctional serine/threonine-protein kinase/ABC transporter substrate-binding protein [Nostoc sphaeroides CHAB 2801]|uniref:bifunctional serine/threonine-protein kinase/ABC transporter substrate-binding protein n=1 Tax=Nostoc sphaeroides TaxID=446679 RepID=UPI000E49C4F4|nr:bifunctional serine/threonine-protein kinase/ABC transporter substrate-binding protein [Nostoc sphaeroides]MCC5629105.1 bifunctional serine/threonine-protein kinase/ABC transporter substrate-binding protein [Nostoc sphaeroides CHAB 2801]